MRRVKLAAVLLFVVLMVAACGESGAAVPQGINKGSRARDFTLEIMDGGKTSLKDYEGKAILINFWATWCPPCRAEIPDIQATYEARQGDGFVVLGVNAEESRATVEQFMGEIEMTYPVLLDESGQVLRAYRVNGLPMSVLVDQEGVIQARHVGYLTADQLEKYLADLMP